MKPLSASRQVDSYSGLASQFLAVVFCGVVFFTVMLSAIGCKPARDPFLELAEAKSKVMQVDDLNRAMDLVFSEQSYNQKEFEEKVSTGLNRWTNKILGDAELTAAGGDASNWQLDSNLTQLVEANRNLDLVARTTRAGFLGSDAFYLRNCAWENRLAKRVCEATPVNALEFYRLAAKLDGIDAAKPRETNVKIVQSLHPELSEPDARSLTDALLLFDWVVRNLHQTDPMQVSAEELPSLKLNDIQSDNPAVNGIRGLGYQHFRWQLLYLARADYVERARLLLGMCRQRGLDAAMLEAKGRPWAVGVLIGGQVFLFDTKLGLPIPGTAPGRVATLTEVREKPELLDSLDLKLEESTREDAKYWVKSADLESVKALILVSPESVSRRMFMLQSRLIGDYQIPISDDPTALLKKFSGLAGVTPAIWDIEFQTHQFRHALRNAIAQSTFDDQVMSKVLWYYTDEAYVDGFAPYRSARDLFVLGRFDSDLNSNKLNAIESFYNLIYSDKRIDNLSLDRGLLGRLGILQDKGQSAAEFQNRLRAVQHQMRLLRLDAGVFLSQSHFDNGNASAAANWLGRMRDRDDTERWMPTIEYVLGRSVEARREYDEAIKLYQRSAAAQSHGNLIRARLLGELTKTSKP
ncbi:MAG: hypothetical protein ACK6CE_02635 [Planctomycetota bacterium]